MCGLTLILIIIVFLAILYFSGAKEGFTISKRDGRLCKPLLNSHTEANLMQKPNVSMVVQGYNYKDTPIFYRDGKKITPLEYEWDYRSMAYYFTLYAPNGICNHQWILQTSDFVEPIVTNGSTNQDFTVNPLKRQEGANQWAIVC